MILLIETKQNKVTLRDYLKFQTKEHLRNLKKI